MKQTILKLVVAILLTVAVVSIYSKQNKSAKVEETTTNNKKEVTKVNEDTEKVAKPLPIITDKKHEIIDNCITAATNKGIEKQLAEKNCKCFLRVAEEKYPEEKITAILMAKANNAGTDDEKANASIIKQCLEENKTITVDKPTVNVIVGDDKATLPKTSSDKKD